VVVTGFILPSRIIGLFLLLLAIALGVAATCFYMSTAAFVRRASRASGTVIDLKPSSGSNGGQTFYAVFEFTDANGAKHQSTTSWASSPPDYSVGEHVTVLYTMNDSADARISGFASLWLSTIISGSISVVNLFFSIVFLWFVPFTIRRVWPTPRLPAR
jgi:hypothetical protein